MLERAFGGLIGFAIMSAAVPAWAEEPAPALATSPLPPPVMERRSSVAMIGGIMLTSAGGLAMLYVGATAMGGCSDDCEAHDNVTRATVLGGAIALAVGIPLIIYGAKRVPTDSAEGAQSALPKWAGAPSAAGWGWSL